MANILIHSDQFSCSEEKTLKYSDQYIFTYREIYFGNLSFNLRVV